MSAESKIVNAASPIERDAGRRKNIFSDLAIVIGRDSMNVVDGSLVFEVPLSTFLDHVEDDALALGLMRIRSCAQIAVRAIASLNVGNNRLIDSANPGECFIEFFEDSLKRRVIATDPESGVDVIPAQTIERLFGIRVMCSKCQGEPDTKVP